MKRKVKAKEERHQLVWEVAVSAHSSGEGYNATSNQIGYRHSTVRKITLNRKTFKTAANLFRNDGPSKSYQLSSTVVEGGLFGLILQPQDLGSYQSLSRPWTLFYIKVFQSQIWSQQSDSYHATGPRHTSKSVAEVQSRSRPSQILRGLCKCDCLDELTQCCLEEWDKTLPQWW